MCFCVWPRNSKEFMKRGFNSYTDTEKSDGCVKKLCLMNEGLA